MLKNLKTKKNSKTRLKKVILKKNLKVLLIQANRTLVMTITLSITTNRLRQRFQRSFFSYLKTRTELQIKCKFKFSMVVILILVLLDSRGSSAPTKNSWFTNLKRAVLVSALKTTGFTTASSRNATWFSITFTSCMIICGLIFPRSLSSANLAVAKDLVKSETGINITKYITKVNLWKN